MNTSEIRSKKKSSDCEEFHKMRIKLDERFTLNFLQEKSICLISDQILNIKFAKTNKMKNRKSYFFQSTKCNYLWVIFWVKKFVEILKTQITKKKLNMLQDFHWNLLNDKSNFPIELRKDKYYKIPNNPDILRKKVIRFY